MNKSIFRTIIIIFILIISSSQVSAWWDTDWTYKNTININNTGSAVTNYQLSFIIDSYNLTKLGKLNSNGSDIRFIASDDTTLLSHWNETAFNITDTLVWVNVTSIPSGTSNVFLYYGNTGATSIINASTTFMLWDDFNGAAGSTTNSSTWTEWKNGTSGPQILTLDGNGNVVLGGKPSTISSASIVSVSTFTNNISIETREKVNNAFYSTTGIGSGRIQGLDGDNIDATGDWWQTVLGNGYAWIVQTYTGGTGGDMFIDNTSNGAASVAISIKSDAANLTTLNSPFYVTYSYNNTGFLSWQRRDFSDYKITLTTPTYDDSGQGIHPDIYYNASGWNGYKYWMGMTPYPSGNDEFENPSILVSNDGFTWIVPLNLINPIDNVTGASHNGDTDIVYNSTSNGLELYWVKFTATDSIVEKSISPNGTSWSANISVLTLTGDDSSPAIIRESDSLYHMWLADTDPATNVMDVYNSTDGGNTWTFWQNTTFDVLPSGKDIWHQDITKVSNEYRCICVFADTGTSGINTVIYFANSTNKLNWTLQPNALVSPEVGYFDSTQPYRGSAIYDENNGDMLLWYSGKSGTTWRTGFVKANYTSTNWTLRNDTRQIIDKNYKISWLTGTNTSWLSDNKNIHLSQGEHTSGNGGNRSVDYVFVRQYVSPEPLSYTWGTETTNSGGVSCDWYININITLYANGTAKTCSATGSTLSYNLSASFGLNASNDYYIYNLTLDNLTYRKFNESSNNGSIIMTITQSNLTANKNHTVKIYWDNGTKFQDFYIKSNNTGYIRYNTSNFNYARYTIIEFSDTLIPIYVVTTVVIVVIIGGVAYYLRRTRKI